MEQTESLERAATRDQLRALNDAARSGGHRHVDDSLIARIPDGEMAIGGALPRSEGAASDGMLLVTWLLPRADVSEPTEHALIEVPEDAYLSLPTWDSLPQSSDGGGCLPILMLAAGAIGVLTYLLGSWIVPGAVPTIGLVVAGAGVLVCGLALALIAWDTWSGDYWDATDQFFGQLELLYALAIGAAVAAAGGVIVALDRLL